MRIHFSIATLAALGLVSVVPAASHAATIVLGTSVIYAAGTQSSLASSAGGSIPTSISVVGDASFTFSVTGTVSLDSMQNINDPDGVGAAPSTSSNSGYGSISGITEPNAGALIGVFVGASGPTGTAPTALNFVTSGTSFTSLSPLLDQTFFIGDGLTGDGTGSSQTFVVPTGATALYFGISDASGYNGTPGSYGDNSGQFNVTPTATLATAGPPAAAPEPSSLVLLGTGALAGLGALRRRFATR